MNKETKHTTNPNKANQHKPDPRQQKFLSNYLDPDSETFGNALKSAEKAGYSHTYALNIMNSMPTWLSEKIEDNTLIDKAKSNLAEFLEEEESKTLKFKASTFVLERLKREKFGRNIDLTSGGEQIPNEVEVKIVNSKDNDEKQDEEKKENKPASN